MLNTTVDGECFYSVMITTNGSSRNQPTYDHLNVIDIQFKVDSEDPIPRPSEESKSKNNGFDMSRFEVLIYKQTPMNIVCTERHIKVMKEAKKEHKFPLLILENDVRMSSKESFWKAMKTALTTPYDWNLFFFSCVSHPVPARIPIFKHSGFKYVITPLMTHAYLLKEKSVDMILRQHHKRPDLAIDKLFRYIDHCVGAWPEVSFQCDNPHQLQALTQRHDGNEWLLSIYASLSVSIPITLGIVFIIFATMFIFRQSKAIRKYYRSYKQKKEEQEGS